MKNAWTHHRWLTLAFSAALILTLLLSLRVAGSWVYWSTHRDAEVQNWMTIGYVARSHELLPRQLFDVLRYRLKLTKGEPETLSVIAIRLDIPMEDLIPLIEYGIKVSKGAE